MDIAKCAEIDTIEVMKVAKLGQSIKLRLSTPINELTIETIVNLNTNKVIIVFMGNFNVLVCTYLSLGVTFSCLF